MIQMLLWCRKLNAETEFKRTIQMLAQLIEILFGKLNSIYFDEVIFEA